MYVETQNFASLRWTNAMNLDGCSHETQNFASLQYGIKF